MIFDVNMSLGTYPFRPLEATTAPQLVSLMDDFGITKACVGSIRAIYYHDAMDGNYELLEEIRGYEDRFVPFAVINPIYAQAKEDFLKCVDELGFKGIRLYPKQHFYSLTDPACVAILKLCGEKKIPVHLQMQMEDLRQTTLLDVKNMVTAQELADVVSLVPETIFILSNAYLHGYVGMLKDFDNVYYDIGRLDNLYQMSFRTVYDAVGAGKIVFGSGAPHQYIGVDVIKLRYLKQTDNLSDSELAAISSETLNSLIR